MPPSELPSMTSASQLSTYATCPRRYAYRYVERRAPERRALGLALGSAVHSALQWWFEMRREGGVADVEGVLEIVRADLAAALSVGGFAWRAETTESLVAEAERLVRSFLATHAELPVLETEVPFELDLVDPETGEILPRRLIGYLDFELQTGNFIELKTAKRAYSETDLRVGLQFAAYRTLARYHGVDVEVLALVRTKVPRVQHVVLPHDAQVSRWFMGAAVRIERAILAGHFPPAPGMACSSCDYRQACLSASVEEPHAQAA